MKKLIFIFTLCCTVFCTTFTSCTNVTEEVTKTVYLTPIWKGSLEAAPESPEVGWAYYNTTDKKSYIYDGENWQVFAQDGKDGADGKAGKDGADFTPDETAKQPDSSMVYVGESSETIDGVTYTVKAYADVYGESEYFYTYYKFYYLEGKVRRVYEFHHGPGCNMDYKYSEFKESSERLGTLDKILYEEYPKIIYTYYDNGLLDTLMLFSCSNMQEPSYKEHYTYTLYEDRKMKSKMKYRWYTSYTDFRLIEENYYYSNGKLGLKFCKGEGGSNYFFFYYESGYQKYYARSGSKIITVEDGASKYFDTKDFAAPTGSSQESITAEQFQAKYEELKALFN